MAPQHSMDIVVQFNAQELKNSVEMSKKEALNRYDLKDSNIEIELSDTGIKIVAQSDYQIEAVFGILIKKMVGRGVSAKILDRQTIEDAGGMRRRQEIKLVKVLDQENAKTISKKIRDAFPKSKPTIQGEMVRITSASIDELQSVIAFLRADEAIKIPLEFTNYR